MESKNRLITTSRLKRITYLLFFLVFLTLLVALYIDSFLSIEPLASPSYSTLDQSWSLKIDGKEVANDLTLPFSIKEDKKGKTVSISRNLPSTYEHSHICFSTTTSMASIEILVDGNSIYSFNGDNTFWKHPILGGKAIHFTYLPDDSMGKEITLNYNFTSNNSVSGRICAPQIGTKTDLILSHLREWPALLFGFIFLLVGSLALFGSFFYDHKTERASLRYYGLLEIALGMWVFSQTASKFIIIRNPVLPMNFSILALFILPYVLIQYVRTSYTIIEKKTAPFYLFSLVFLSMFVVGGVAQFTGLFEYSDMLIFSGLALVIFIVSVTVVLGIDYFKGNRDLKSFLAAISVLFITVLAEEVLLILDISLHSALILHIGMTICGVILLVRTASVIASVRSLSVKENMLLELAFTDSLTGVNNRRSFDDFIDTVIHGEVDIDILGIIMCDINNLKKINDLYGHSAGDSILREFSRGLQSHLPESSTIYRIGGDEFVAIIPNITSEQLELTCKKVFTLSSASHIELFSVAIGTRLFIKQHTSDIITLIKEADKAMYECKAKMKNEEIENTLCDTEESDILNA
ncbi:MAG: diguanylate cyclase [Spirochaetia bacterium]|nr:diguanylate cyclase [Spirochaetia bacterium]